MGFCGSRDDALRVDNGVLQNECFVDVLNIVPHAIFLLISVFILIVWNRSVLGQLHVTTWVHYHGHSLRWTVTIVLVISCVVGIAEGVMSDYMDQDTVNVHAFLPQCLALAAALGSITYYHNVEQWNSPRFLLVLMGYWLSMIVLKFLKAFSLYKNDVTHIHLRVWLTWFDVLLYLILLGVELNVLRVQRYAFFKKYIPAHSSKELGTSKYIHDHVNLLSKASFWWLNSTLMEGYRTPLEMEDLGPLPKTEGAVAQYAKLHASFEEEKYKASCRNQSPSFHKSYLRAFGPMLVFAGVLRLLGVLLSFVGPWCIEHIVDYSYKAKSHTNTSQSGPTVQTYVINNGTDNSTFSTLPDSKNTLLYVEVSSFFSNGYVLCVILFIGTLLEHTLMQNHHFIVIRQGVRLRAALQTMIFGKALKLSSLVINSGKMTIGQIMNHMSMDTVFLMHLFFFIHFFWGGPLQIILALLLMYYKLGWSAVIGGSLVILAVPLQYFAGSGLSNVQKKCMSKADKRVKKTNEVIQGISVVKLLAWEPFFTKSITETRTDELRSLYFNSLFRVLLSFIGIAVPAIGTMLAFLIHPYLEDEPFTVGKALSTLSLFNLLQLPCWLITHFVNTFVTANVSVKRLLPYFLAEEVEGPGGRGAKTHTHSIGVETTDLDSIRLGLVVDISNGTRKTSSLLRKDEDTSSLSSLESTYSRTPMHSRHGSRASLLDTHEPNKRASIGRTSAGSVLTVSEPAEPGRRRHTSGVSTEDEDDVADVTTVIEPRATVEVVHGNFSWELESKELSLKNINIKIPSGKLTIIVGPVGSGKSSLLSAVLGEMITVSGTVDWNRGTRRAYVSQKPWLLNASLKNNILFGQQFQWRRYNKVLQACALQPDIASLPAGDNTEIGEKGVNLSGGQKQRVSIARALYSKADTIILDDPLSALDAHVGKHVFEDAILKRLLRRKRTVILVTHHLQYLNQANHVIVMKEGSVQYQGKLTDVKKVDPDLYESWRRALRDFKSTQEPSQKETLGTDNKELPEHTDSDVALVSENLLRPEGHRRPSGQMLGSLSHRRLSTQLSNMEEETTSQEGNEMEDHSHDKGKGNHDRNKAVNDTETGSKVDADSSGKLIKKEHREIGAVAMGVYVRYGQACCPLLAVIVLMIYVIYHACFVGSNMVLATWTEAITDYETRKQMSSNFTETFDNGRYMRIYSILNLSGIGGAMLASGLLYIAAIKASKVLHSTMLDTILHIPIRFFDTNPTGRILNRFSSDMSQIDQHLPNTLENLMKCFFLTISALIVNSIGTPYFLLAAIPLVILYFCIQTFFRATTRELQRLDSLTKSPIFSHFSETLNGLQTIRAYKAEGQFQCHAIQAINNNTTPLLFIHSVNRWLGIRLDYMGAVVVFLAAVSSLSACLAGQTTPASVGLSITYALLVSFYLNWIVRLSAETEMMMNSVERVDEYTQLDTEPVRHPEGNLIVDKTWPENGEIEFLNVSLRYEENLDPVVNEASFIIHGGEKIGICGRTGSGKSSLLLSLFRMIDICQGQILIDGKDTMKIPLPELRSKLAIIPQDPVLFEGTIRYNLAPKCDISDERLWLALETVQLKDTISALPEKLDSSVSEGGENFSVGQKQLFCLARAFLRENQILILDEATASIDLETDSKLQNVISTAFQNRTVITIAHRISTILKYDRVLVMDNGHIVEINTPEKLLEDTDSHFYALVHQAKK
ncbi:LOW QUALITY PROTEIN: ATP-binding cassette sub-family C member 9-like [Pecten maximus]|uniref:LOW QUALITY PROTEIN: ATP-binding cassette sub-family C member 9-like n=1 Tax=Pecten maximus TaxID=6579 RepID=UPI0014585867|nr:LOW QUALITY PROTEIN: ATP-binding cassette sub-family C member 9-like [Pecten maximus]